MSEQKKAVIIGAGFGGLSLSILLARDGWDVTILEKNEQAGGRAGIMETNGFKFDLVPSWYLMPDVFDRFFASVGEKTSYYYDLVKLKPSYRVTYKDYDQQIDIYGDLKKDRKTFESIESGAGEKLQQYLERSAYVYDVSVNKFLYRNYDSAKDFMSHAIAREAHKL